jgi:hypothetical protein
VPVRGLGLRGTVIADLANSALENLLPVPVLESVDVTEALVYLCGQSGRYITGITLPVDAGFNAK